MALLKAGRCREQTRARAASERHHTSSSYRKEMAGKEIFF